MTIIQNAKRPTQTNLPRAAQAPSYHGAFVTLVCNIGSKPIVVQSIMDATTPMITDGYGGWVVIPRRKKVGILDWQGNNPKQMKIGLMLDAWGPNALRPNHVEGDCQNLELMASANRNNNTRPPIVTFLVDDAVLPAQNLKWVIEDLVWGDGIKNRDTGMRTRQQVSLTMREMVEDTLLNTLSPALTRRTATISEDSLAFPRTYTVKAGDTMGSIASRIYGKEALWHKIAKANKIRDPNGIRVGQVLKIPPPNAPTTTPAKTTPAPTGWTGRPQGR